METQKPKLKVPGAGWVVGIVVLLGLAHYYLKDPYIMDLALIVAGLILPAVVDNDSELRQALAAIELLSKRRVPLFVATDGGEEGMDAPTPMTSNESVRGGPSPTSRSLGLEPVVKVPPQPNRLLTWFRG